MTTTPTLYVKGYYTRLMGQRPDGSYNAMDVPTERPATHDELIAAMPRCGTCGYRDETKENPNNVTRSHYCVKLGFYVHRSFGCTEHKERV